MEFLPIGHRQWHSEFPPIQVAYPNWRMQGISGNFKLIEELPSPRTTAGSDARVGCEPGQVRKEAALSRSGSVPSCPRSSFAAMGFLDLRISDCEFWISVRPPLEFSSINPWPP